KLKRATGGRGSRWRVAGRDRVPGRSMEFTSGGDGPRVKAQSEDTRQDSCMSAVHGACFLVGVGGTRAAGPCRTGLGQQAGRGESTSGFGPSIGPASGSSS